MPEIEVLSPQVAEQIAAGEIVENPASVVKELVENSLDAGADYIEVKIKEGGLEEITVFDNGHGLASREIPLAFQRHATSKLHSVEQLYFSLDTLGFRGEALPSIASVSRMMFTTKKRGAEVGIAVNLEGGEIVTREETGCPEGTEVCVKDLFFNTPARKKFLKSRSAEVSRITRMITGIAFSHPWVSLVLFSEDKLLLKSRGDGDILHIVAEAYGREVARSMVPIEERDEEQEMVVRGYISPPYVSRSSRRYQNVVVNNRMVNSPTVSRSMEKGYRGLLDANRFPIAVIYVDLLPSFVDVNVHPSKSEVRFHNSGNVEDLVYKAVSRALRYSSPAYYFPESGYAAPEYSNNAADKTDQFSVGKVQERLISGYRREQREKPRSRLEGGSLVKPGSYTPPAASGTDSNVFSEANKHHEAGTEHSRENKVAENYNTSETRRGPLEAGMEENTLGATGETRVIGQYLSTYIVMQKGDNLMLVDQHAAHERVLYQKFVEEYNRSRVPRVSLAIPVTVEVPSSLMQMFNEMGPGLEKIGFKIEPFGNNICIIREVPSFLMDHFNERLMLDIVEELTEVGEYSGEEALEMFKVFACKGAVKANQGLDRKEMEDLISQWEQTENASFCPHGRPAALSFTVKELQKAFHRGGGERKH